MFDIIKILENYLPKYKKVLELGSKQGEDLEILDGYYEVIASEDEKTKTRYLKDKYIDIRVILIDSITLDTHKRFECIYSKNLLDDLSLEELSTSFENQKKLLDGKSLIFHIFDEEKISQKDIKGIILKNYKILDTNSKEGNFYILATLI